MQKLVPAYEGKEKYIFVSYAHKDSSSVLPIIESLYNDKYRVWYDEGISPGSEWPKNIADHLAGCDGVLVFKSRSYDASPNCQNENKIAYSSQKTIWEVDALATDYDRLKELIPKEYIGDGTGYDRYISSDKRKSFWNILIAVAVIFALGLGVGLYGLSEGWFDSYLPGLQNQNGVLAAQSAAIQNDTAIGNGTDLKNNIVDISNNLVAKAVANQLEDKANLAEVLTFSSEEEKNNFYDMLGYDPGEEGEMTLLNLTSRQAEELHVMDCTDTILEYLTHMPNLRRVYVRFADFPLTIPENASYEVLLSNN